MTCYKPLHGWRSAKVNPATGKRGIVFELSKAFNDVRVSVPCGQCIGCRLERSRKWAMRIMHEVSLHEDNMFITLTYSPEHLPETGTLIKSDFQKFMKRLRKRYQPRPIRFFHCGEYGAKYRRPHYHAIIFGLDFEDKKFAKFSKAGFPLYRSQILERLWTFGFSDIGEVSFESAAYVARYCVKKQTGKNALEHYCEIDYETGEILNELEPEYCTMSNGIGKGWFEKHKFDIYPKDSVTLRGIKMQPPPYYDELYERLYPEDMAKIKARRVNRRREAELTGELDDERLDVKCKVKTRRANMLRRDYEHV